MPSAVHLKGSSSSAEGQVHSAEPELTLSTKRKISMLPDLRRQQSSEQRKSSTQLSVQHKDQAETVTQSADQVAELSQIGSDTHRSFQPTNSTRHTISGHIEASVVARSSSQANNIPKMPEQGPPAINHCRKPSYVANVTNFDAHRGETAITRPPIVGDDLLSRLEGLRQFKEWSARIHDNAHQQADLLPKAGSQYAPAPTNDIRTVERCEERIGMRACSARIEHDLPLCHDSELVERNIDAPTPFSSPQVTPVPSVTAHTEQQQQQQSSASLPDLDLSAALSQDFITHVAATGHSKTVIISSESPNLQLVPRSRSTSRTRLDTQAPRRANSKPRSHPPISFPKDFYERFPHVEEPLTCAREIQVQHGAKASPGVSPNVILAQSQDDQVISEDIEPLATPHDRRGRPVFYSTIHYFTDCPHASPPANRPLDPHAQPRPDPDFHPSDGTTIRSIIPGACFNCDVTNRRCKEDDVLNANAAQIAQLTNELARALDELELDDSDDEMAGYLHDKHSARLLTPSTFAEDKYDLDIETEDSRDLPPLSDDPEITSALRSGKLRTTDQKSYMDHMTKQIRDLEAQVDHLHDEQDNQIKKAWLGFTPRWGPGTLGVQRGRQATSVPRVVFKDNEQAPSQHPSSIATDDTEDVQVVTAGTGDQDLGVNALSTRGSILSHGTSRARSGSSRSRSGTRTPTSTSSVSARDVPGSRTPGEGKMRIGWIREEKD